MSDFGDVGGPGCGRDLVPSRACASRDRRVAGAAAPIEPPSRSPLGPLRAAGRPGGRRRASRITLTRRLTPTQSFAMPRPQLNGRRPSVPIARQRRTTRASCVSRGGVCLRWNVPRSWRDARTPATSPMTRRGDARQSRRRSSSGAHWDSTWRRASRYLAVEHPLLPGRMAERAEAARKAVELLETLPPSRQLAKPIRRTTGRSQREPSPWRKSSATKNSSFVSGRSSQHETSQRSVHRHSRNASSSRGRRE